ncbi:MAG: ATP-binding cassette domain-containing protein [Hyphomicrobiaceae bacterium]
MSKVPLILNKSRRRDAALVVLMGVGQAIAMGVGIFATRDAFSSLHGGGKPGIWSLGLLLLAGFAVAGLQMASRIRAEAIGQSFAKSLRRVLYRQIAGMSDAERSQLREGALSLRFVGDLSAARGWAGPGLTRLASAGIVLPGAAMSLYLMSATLALAGMIPILLSVTVSIGLAVGLTNYHRDLRSHRARIAISMMERLRISGALDLAGRTRREIKSLDESSTRVAKDAVNRMTRLSLLRSLPQWGAAVGGAAVLWATGEFGLPPAEAAAALALLTVLVLPLHQLTDVWDRYCAWRIAKLKCERLLRHDSQLRRIEARTAPVPITFEGVEFRGMQMELHIPAGACVQISGAAGSWKSAFLSLVAGQNRPDKGHVSYGENDNLPRIAYVSDVPLVVHGSLRRNLTLGGRRRPPDETLVDCLQHFGLAALLDRIGGLDGRVHEHGRTLSSGEVLRIELARTVVTEPDLIVIDSAQFSADSSSENLIARLRSKCRATLVFSGSSSISYRDVAVLRLNDPKANAIGADVESQCKLHAAA